MTVTVMFDPGRSTGVVLGHYYADKPWKRLAAWQVEDGVSGLARWINWAGDQASILPLRLMGDPAYAMGGALNWDGVEVGAEKWIPYPTAGHSPTLDSTYPLVCEGVLISLGLMPEYPHQQWQRSSEQYPFNAPAHTPSAKKLDVKKKLRQDWMKDTGTWLTGKDVGRANADDAISATAHQLMRLRKLEHLPTILKYWPNEKEEM